MQWEEVSKLDLQSYQNKWAEMDHKEELFCHSQRRKIQMELIYVYISAHAMSFNKQRTLK